MKEGGSSPVVLQNVKITILDSFRCSRLESNYDVTKKVCAGIIKCFDAAKGNYKLLKRFDLFWIGEITGGKDTCQGK